MCVCVTIGLSAKIKIMFRPTIAQSCNYMAIHTSVLLSYSHELLSPSWCRSSCLPLRPWRAAGTPSQSFWTWRSVQDLHTGVAHHILREKQRVGKRRVLFYFIWHHDKQHPIVFPSPAIWTYWRDQWHNPAKGSRKQLTSNWFNSQMGKWRSRCMSVHALSGMFCLWVGVCTLSGLPVCILQVSLLRSPKSSTPSAAKMKKSSMKRRPRLPTCRETPANQCHIWNVCMH